jgi:iron(III) transport system substrate-binding protein
MAMRNPLPAHLTRRHGLGLALAWLAAPVGAQNLDELLDYAPRASAPAGYPAAYATLVRAAEDEGRLVIYATTDEVVARPLLDDFKALYPRINIDYEDLTSTELHYRFVAETQLRRASADVVWSSSMDLQASLVTRGDAATYVSPERDGLPDWAKWNDQAWATTFEPIAIAYRKADLEAARVPRSHGDLARLLKTDAARLQGKVITYDIARSGLGFFLATQDVGASPAFWDIARGLGLAKTRFSATTSGMLQQLASGKATLAYNVLGSYALMQARRNPAIGVVFPSDYTLVMSRLQLISRHATHPNAARLWVDYLLSQRGQALLANQAGLFAVRADVRGSATAAGLTQTLGPSLRTIPVGPALTDYLEAQKSSAFIRQWHQALGRPSVR